MSDLTQTRAESWLNGCVAEVEGNVNRKDQAMLIAIFVTTVIAVALGLGQRAGRDGLIGRRPYSNRYNDASGARQEY
ncbi:MAG TPA: hypothetical protein VH115_02890 [Solirubrobacteraceae bacterium]|nr:hypothetical protein [Solirubrobacteraceae bacterium]